MTQWLAGMRITAARLNDITSVSGGGTFTPATGICTLNTFDDQVTPGGMYVIFMSLAYTGSTLTGSSTGNVGDTLLGTLSGVTLPENSFSALARGNTSAGTANEFGMLIGSDGTFKIEAIPATATIKSGDNLLIQASWVAG